MQLTLSQKTMIHMQEKQEKDRMVSPMSLLLVCRLKAQQVREMKRRAIMHNSPTAKAVLKQVKEPGGRKGS